MPLFDDDSDSEVSIGWGVEEGGDGGAGELLPPPLVPIAPRAVRAVTPEGARSAGECSGGEDSEGEGSGASAG